MKVNTLFAVSLTFIPSTVLAEVSDKIPSIPNIYISAICVGLAAFSLSWFRWWFVFLGLAAGVFFAIGAISLWQEIGMREALISEQGNKYFVALGLEPVIVILGAILGFMLARRKTNAA